MPDELQFLGFGSAWRLHAPETPTVRVVPDHPLYRIMSFTGDSIDNIVNCPIAKNRVRAYWRVYRQVQRTCEIVDLERWWNPPAKSVERKVV